ncbi:MAG: hypothetical protein HYY50_04670 [Candidatus Kerfeldbacteria bacterium]|nr:hypothetical protein [Candidatus Kerfeldbacteria bacterium]
MLFLAPAKLWLVGGSTAALAALVVVVGFSVVRGSLQTGGSNDASSNQARERYAAFYEAAWRQDQAQGSVLMTATVLLPPAIAALGEDQQRSETEDQLYRQLVDLPAKAIAIFLTLDSVAGPIPDDNVKNSLTLAAERGPIFQLLDWHPMIRPARLSNTAVVVSPQAGLAVFQANRTINWSELRDLTLVSRGVGDIAERSFVWTQPSLLLDSGP